MFIFKSLGHILSLRNKTKINRSLKIQGPNWAANI